MPKNCFDFFLGGEFAAFSFGHALEKIFGIRFFARKKFSHRLDDKRSR